MVERECVTHQKKADRAKEKSVIRAAKKRSEISAKKKAEEDSLKAHWKIGHLDIVDEFCRICSYPHARGALERGLGRLPDLYLSRRCRTVAYRAMAYRYSGEIRMWLAKDLDVIRFATVSCHEIAHIINEEETSPGPGSGHGDGWWSHFQEILHEAYDVRVTGVVGGNKYRKDAAVIEALKSCAWLSSGGDPPQRPIRPRGMIEMKFHYKPMHKSGDSILVVKI
jgi:hypothetical protein